MASRQAAHQRRIRAERVASGLCRDCGADSDGQYRCASCQARSSAYVRAWQSRQSKKQRRRA